MKQKQIRPRLLPEEYEEFLQFQNNKPPKDETRVLVIADLHAPFVLDGYLDFCKSIKIKYKTNRTVFVGDLVDNHFSGYHETDPDGLSAGDELKSAEEQIQEWYKAFPTADVLEGNHDLIPDRKRVTGGIAKRWLKSIDEVLNVPNWTFHERLIIDNVMYVHGINMKARTRMHREHTSIVQGHYHSEGYLEYSVGWNFKFFAMQLGAGIDRKAYAFAYGKHFLKPHVNCGIVIGGKQAYLEYMEL